jgi:hypothetical protein
MTPFLVNIQETELDSPRFPPFFEKAWRISLTARFLLSVRTSTMRATPGAVALVGNLFIRNAFELAGAALDGSFDVVGRHVLGLGGDDGSAEARIAVWVATAGLGGDGDFLDKAGEDLAAFGVGGALFMLDCRPFRVTGHGLPR